MRQNTVAKILYYYYVKYSDLVKNQICSTDVICRKACENCPGLHVMVSPAQAASGSSGWGAWGLCGRLGPNPSTAAEQRVVSGSYGEIWPTSHLPIVAVSSA